VQCPNYNQGDVVECGQKDTVLDAHRSFGFVGMVYLANPNRGSGGGLIVSKEPCGVAENQFALMLNFADGKVQFRGFGFPYIQAKSPSLPFYSPTVAASWSSSWDSNKYAFQMTSTDPLPLGVWTEVAFVVVKGQGLILFNGNVQANATTNAIYDPPVHQNKLSIMVGSRHPAGRDTFPGRIANLTFYNINCDVAMLPSRG